MINFMWGMWGWFILLILPSTKNTLLNSQAIKGEIDKPPKVMIHYSHDNEFKLEKDP